MTKKLFKNRIMQEDEKTIRKLKSTYIEMNTDKETTDDTYDGLFFISLQPNDYTNEITLVKDFKFVLCLYYRWMYGTSWYKKYELQYNWKGLVEKQAGNHYHIHFKMYEYNIEKLAIFLGYIKAVFKQLHPKASFNFQRVYDDNGCDEYISPTPAKKDKLVSKRRSETFYLESKMFQKKINTNGTSVPRTSL